MSLIIKAHFDGKAIVPDSELDLPSDQPLEVKVRLLPSARKMSETSKLRQSPQVGITLLPFFGMWADRDDMKDSAEWVRREREKWSSRLSGAD